MTPLEVRAVLPLISDTARTRMIRMLGDCIYYFNAHDHLLMSDGTTRPITRAEKGAAVMATQELALIFAGALHFLDRVKT